MFRIQEEDFDVAEEYQRLLLDDSCSGAVVMFVGRVRDFNQGENIHKIQLEHYPAMAQHYFVDLEQRAYRKWPLQKMTIIHRIGTLKLTDQIVLVLVSSTHRDVAFQAAQGIMDCLKKEAPFWKKEYSVNGTTHWVSP